MGLFDTIECCLPLPIPTVHTVELAAWDFQSFHYQTKDLGQYLKHFTISRTGELFWRDRCRETGDLFWVKSDKTIDVTFYTFVTRQTHSYYVEYKATFVRGQLLDPIKLISFTVSSNDECKREWVKVEEFKKRRDAFILTWYGLGLYTPYRNFVKRFFARWRKFARKLPASYKIEHFLTPY